MATQQPSRRRGARAANLLVEIGTEELPPRALPTLAQAFAAHLARALADAGVLAEADNHRSFATPRRLAALVNGVLPKQPKRVEERRGPSLQAARDRHGAWSRAATGFAEACGVGAADLDVVESEKGAWLVYRRPVAGLKLDAIVTDCLEHSLRRLPIPKRMRWGAGRAEFVRPAHWLLALHGSRVVKTHALGLTAGRMTRGHRFHANHALAVASADEYAETLEYRGWVIADFERRRGIIKKQIHRLAGQIDARADADAALLDLVTGLVEWPNALRGEFHRRFLKIPAEALMSSMRDHQKYFHLTDAAGKLLPAFIAVSNIKIPPTSARVRHGNERVLRARLADAEFFWKRDLSIPTADRIEQLKGVVFHHQLGSLFDKSRRMAILADYIAARITTEANSRRVGLAVALSKADLVTDMVGEFPNLQGIIGRHYAKKAGHAKPICDAIEQHYWPRQAGDPLPPGAIAQSVALADRLDSLLGLFAASEIPSGDKDPFALRRAALGALRILIEKEIDLDLYDLLQVAQSAYQHAHKDNGLIAMPTADHIEQVFEFMFERLKAYYQPMGYSAAELLAVMACKPRKPLDFDRRLQALSGFFKQQPEAAASLAAANKRIARILLKANINTNQHALSVDESLFRHHAETELARQLKKINARADQCFTHNQYDAGFKTLATLKQPVDKFFDGVMVMDEDTAIRNNRLALLHNIRQLFLGAADLSRMQAER